MADQKLIIRDVRNGDWFWANKLLLDHPYFTPATKLTYCALTYFANNNTQKAHPSIETISKITGLSRPTITSAIKVLEKYHFIKVDKKSGKVNKYTLLKITDSRPVKNFNQLKRRYDQLKRRLGVVKKMPTNNTY